MAGCIAIGSLATAEHWFVFYPTRTNHIGGVFGFSVVIRCLNFLQHLTECKYFISRSAVKQEKFEDWRMITDALVSDQDVVVKHLKVFLGCDSFAI